MGAVIAWLLRFPMWAMTGPLIGAAAGQLLADGAVHAHPALSVCAQVLIGAAVGSRLGRGVLRDLKGVVLPGLLVVIVIVIGGLSLGAMISFVGVVDPITAMFGSAPGGVGEMVAAAAALEGDPAVVAAMHMSRILVVLLLVRAVARRLPS